MAKSIRQNPHGLLGALRLLALTAPSGRVAAAEAMGILHAIAGFETSSVMWIDRLSRPVDVLDSFVAPVWLWQDYAENFHGKPALEAGGLSHARVQASGERVWSLSAHRDHAAYTRSEFYNRIGKEIGTDWTVALPLRHSNGTPLANFLGSRRFHSRDFSAAETRLLQQAQPWLEHLLRREDTTGTADTGSYVRDSATLLIEPDGRLAAASAGALHLLHYAADIPLSGGALKRSVDGDVRLLLQRFARAVAAGIHGMPVLPPECSINNRWGNFHLRAYALTDGGAGQTILHIDRLQPVWLALFRAPRFLAMSARQREVCLHLAAGLTHTEIARIMEVKPSTVIYFIRQIYLRLNITQRNELIGALTQESDTVLRA